MDKLTAIKIKYDDGTYSDQIPVSATAGNVQWDSTHSLIDILGQVAFDTKGTIQDQITQLFTQKVNSADLATYVNSTMKTEVTQWLSTYISPATGTISYDASLSIEGAAADAKAAGQIVKISTTKPTQENTRIWVGAAEEEYQVPTMQELEELEGEIAAVKSDLSYTNNEVFEIDNISIPITYTQKYISSTGRWYTSSIASASDYFAVVPNQRVMLSGVLLTDYCCIAAFYADKTFASKIAGGTNDTTVSFVVPEDCYYIAVTAPLDATTVEGKILLSSNIKENADKIQRLEAVSFNKTIQFFLTDILRELAWTITNGDGLIESFEQIMGRKSIVIGKLYDYALISDEYVTKTGIIEGYASWSRTNAIPCDNVDSLVFTGNGTVFTTAGYSVFYDKDMNFISNFTVTLTNDITSVTIPVPQNANTFIISANTNQFANLVSIVPTRGE